MPTFPRDERPPPSAFGVEPFDVSQRSATRSATAGARATWFSLTSSCVCRSGKAGAPPSPAHTRTHPGPCSRSLRPASPTTNPHAGGLGLALPQRRDPPGRDPRPQALEPHDAELAAGILAGAARAGGEFEGPDNAAVTRNRGASAGPGEEEKLHKRTGSRTFGKYPPNEPTIADILRRTGIATDLRRSTRRVGAMLAQASPLNRCPLVASCWRHVLCL